MCEKVGGAVKALVLNCAQEVNKTSVLVEIINSKHFPILILCLTFLTYSVIYFFFKTKQRINFSTQQNIQMQGEEPSENADNFRR